MQKMHTYPGGKNAWKGLIAAEYVGVTVETPPFQMGVTNRSTEFLQIAPTGKVIFPISTFVAQHIWSVPRYGVMIALEKLYFRVH